MPAQEYIYLDIETENCRIIGSCNGLPVMNKVFNGKSDFLLPINQVLSKKNTCQIMVVPLELSGTELPDVRVKIKRYTEDDLVASPDSGEILTSAHLKGYVTETLSFDNEILDFSYLLTELPVIENENEVREFGNTLNSLFVSQKSNSIRNVFSPKLRDYAKAYFENPVSYTEGFINFLRYEFFPLKLLEQSSDMVLTSYLDKRIWRIGRTPDLKFIRSNPNENDNGYTIDIFVAKVNNEMAVIR